MRRDITPFLLSAVHAARFRMSVVTAYAAAIVGTAMMRPVAFTVDWAQVNAAILKKWSPAALLYIKQQAWAAAAGVSAKERV